MFTTLNETPYPAETFILPDQDGLMSAVSVIKATYHLDVDGALRISDSQIPLCCTDEYMGEPGKSSVRYPSDLVCEKKGTDIAVNGHVYAPGRVPVRECPAMVQVGKLRKIIAVRGDRVFRSLAGFVTRSAPEPFVKMPLGYERAFGGSDISHPDAKHHGVFMENPIGVGYRASRSKKAVQGCALPNFEDVKNRIVTWTDRPRPAGFGCVPPNWEPRLSYAGTFDESWKNSRMPLPPMDADIRRHNAAAEGLTTGSPLLGRESVRLVNLHPHHESLWFTLPGLSLTAAFTFDHETMKPRPVLDTLIIEPDDNRMILVYRVLYRGELPLSGLRQVRIYETS